MNEVNNIPVLNIKYSETDEWIPIPAIKGTSVGVTIASATSAGRSGTLVTLLDEGKKILDPSYIGDIFFVPNGLDGLGAVKTVDSISPDSNGEVSLSAVRYVAQNLSDDSKTQARINIGALAADASSTADPIMDGTASPGSSSSWARGDHVHPTDTSRASVVELATYTRPNLLANWYFVGGGSQLDSGIFPVNQRGQTSYPNSGYFIDRWYSGGSLSITVLSQYVTVANSDSNYHYITQPLTSIIDAIKGKTVTLSFLTDADLFSTTLTLPPASSTDWTDDQPHIYGNKVTSFGSIRISISAGITSAFIVFNPDASANFLAAKLEIGSTQTLAHQENDAWVLNEVPNWSEQFYFCTTAEKSGILKAVENGTIIPAVAGTDYVVPTALSAKQDKITASGILKGNGSGGVSEAVAGTDYLTPATNFSPVAIASSDYSFVAGDAGKTIRLETNAAVFTMTQAVSSLMPIGTEIALMVSFLSPSAYFTVVLPGGRTFGANRAFTTAKCTGGYALFAIKKLWGDTADVWLLTGPDVEVVT